MDGDSHPPGLPVSFSLPSAALPVQSPSGSEWLGALADRSQARATRRKREEPATSVANPDQIENESDVQAHGTSDKAVLQSLESIASMLDKVKLPALVHKNLKSIHAQLSKNAIRLQKANQRLQKVDDSIAALTHEKVPNNCKPYKLPFECPELDDACYGEKTLLTLELPAGATFRQAKIAVYYWGVLQEFKLDKALNQKQIDNLKASASYDTYMKECKQTYEEYAEAIQSSTLSAPPGLFENQAKDVEQIANLMFKSTVEKIALTQIEKKKELSKKQANEEKFVEQLLRRDPVERFGDAVEHVLLKRGAIPAKKSAVAKLQYQYDIASSWLTSAGSSPDKSEIKKHISFSPEMPDFKPKNDSAPLPVATRKDRGANGGKGKGKGRGSGGQRSSEKTQSGRKGKGKGKQKGKGGM